MKWCAIQKSGEVKNLKLIHIKFVPSVGSFSPAMSLPLELRTEKYAEIIFALSWSCVCFVFFFVSCFFFLFWYRHQMKLVQC